jgi:Ca-activated chloride channel homolog
VGNLMPGDRVEVDLRYSELLSDEERIYEFVFPTVVGPRYSSQPAAGAPEKDRFVETPYLKEGKLSTTTFDIQVTLDTGVPLHDMVSPSHKTTTDWTGGSRAVVRLAPEESHGGNRDFILRYRLAGERIATGLLLYESADERFFLLMAQPPARVAPADLPGREYIFVVDVSGSMHGFPLNTTKALLRDLIGGLKPTDTFNVLLFSGDSHLMSPQSLPATQANIAQAIHVIDSQHGGGGTELLAAMQRAVHLPREEAVARSIVLVTDGYISAEAAVFGLISEQVGRTNVFSFGIGSSVNRHLIEGVARAGRGEPFIVTGPAEAAGTAARFRRYIESPVLTQIAVAFEGLDAYDVEPSRFPDLLAERPLVAFGKWRGPAAGNIVITGTTGGGAYRHAVHVGQSAPSTDHSALVHLWARTRIARLSDFGTTGSAEENRPEIVALGLRYNLLTAFTSFIAVHEVIRNPGGDGANVDQPLPLPQGVSNHAVGGMTQASEPELPLVLLALASVALALRMRAVRR